MSFRATEFKCCCFFVKDYNIKVKSAIRPILFSSRPIRLQLYCTLAIIFYIDASVLLQYLFYDLNMLLRKILFQFSLEVFENYKSLLSSKHFFLIIKNCLNFNNRKQYNHQSKCSKDQVQLLLFSIRLIFFNLKKISPQITKSLIQ